MIFHVFFSLLFLVPIFVIIFSNSTFWSDWKVVSKGVKGPLIITYMYVQSPLGFAASDVPQAWQLALRTFCFAVGLCLWTTPLRSKQCRFSKLLSGVFVGNGEIIWSIL